MKKSIILFCLLFSTFIFSQESEEVDPFFNLLLNDKATQEQKSIFNNLYLQTADNKTINLPNISSIIDKISLKSLNNANLESVANKMQKEENPAINIYGKIVDYESNIADVSKRFIYQDRYYNIVEITSETAQSLQVYFKEFNLPTDATLFVYDAKGIMTLGAFTSKNNPKNNSDDGYKFMIQPIIGNKIYIELSYPVTSTQTPILNLKSIVHGFKGFYSGPYGTAGDCHKNVSCLFNGFNDRGRSMKSVGLILANYKSNGNFAFSCSGALLNNSSQDGIPYFLTASHCVGAANTGNYNWQNEFLVLFNYETKLCNDTIVGSSYTLSKNSTLGAELLVDSSPNWKDFALLKLRTTKDIIARYNVCYAGWDNAPLAYTANTFDRYGVHHPKGDVKKISLVKNIFPADINFDPYSGGDYLAVSWKDGIVEQGSSGSPLFNSFDRVIGNLSKGRDPQIFNCNNPDKYTDPDLINTYSRFSNNFLQMKQWLDPNFTSAQSIGPYCPSGIISIGIPNTYNPPININYERSVDINHAYVHPSQTFGKKIYVPYDSYNSNPLLKISDDNIIATKSNLFDPINGGLRLSGIYKIVDCNKLQYLDDDIILEMKNPINASSYQDATVIGLGNNRVIVKLNNSSGNYYNEEVQAYKIVGKKLVFEGWINLFQNITGHNLTTYYANNRLLVFNSSTKTLYSWFLSDNGAWVAGNPQTFTEYIDVKMVDDKFFISEVLQTLNKDSKNKMLVYTFVANSPNYNLSSTFTNLYNSNNIIINSQYNWKVINISKNKNKTNSFYVNYIHRSQGDPFNRIVEVDLNTQSINHLNLGGEYNLDFNLYGYALYSSHIIDDKIIQLKSNNVTTGPGPVVRISIFAKNANNVWTLEKGKSFYQGHDYAINDKYLLQHIGKSPVNILNLQEVEFLFHPETIDDATTSGLSTAAYNMIRDFTYNTLWKGMAYGKDIYDNRNAYGTFFPFKHNHLNNYNEGSISQDNKAVILSDYTKQIDGAKIITAYAKYSIFLKPGFSVSSYSGAEFNAIPLKNINTANIPICSFTFDDMLNPILGQYSQQIYLKQGLANIDSPYYGEIVYLSKDEESNILQEKNYKIYPNPTKDILYIDFNGKSFKTLEVYSIDGRKIITKEVSSMNIVEVNLSQYPAGIYMITLIDSNGKTYPNKIIKK